MLTIKKLSGPQQPQILPLLGRCFPDYWEQLAEKEQKMPFDELSFAAFENGVVAGHCGMMFYEVYDCSGVPRLMGGIASVAVHPDFRKQGIAAKLCQYAADWAENEPEIISLPLYTGLFRVYESVSWQQISAAPAVFARPDAAGPPLQWRSGKELSGSEKSRIAAIYDAMPAYPGKVLRKNGTEFHGWKRIFSEPEFLFALSKEQYAVLIDNTLAEIGFLPGTNPEKFVAAALGSAGRTMLLPDFVTAGMPLTRTAADHDPRHGEKVLVRDLKQSMFHRDNPDLFFSLVDKF